MTYAVSSPFQPSKAHMCSKDSWVGVSTLISTISAPVGRMVDEKLTKNRYRTSLIEDGIEGPPEVEMRKWRHVLGEGVHTINRREFRACQRF